MLQICEIVKSILIKLTPNTCTFKYLNTVVLVLYNKSINNLRSILDKITNLPMLIFSKFTAINAIIILQNIVKHLKSGPRKKFSY